MNLEQQLNDLEAKHFLTYQALLVEIQTNGFRSSAFGELGHVAYVYWSRLVEEARATPEIERELVLRMLDASLTLDSRVARGLCLCERVRRELISWGKNHVLPSQLPKSVRVPIETTGQLRRAADDTASNTSLGRWGAYEHGHQVFMHVLGGALDEAVLTSTKIVNNQPQRAGTYFYKSLFDAWVKL